MLPNFKSLSEQQLAPVALFAFNRPESLKRTIHSLAENHLADITEVFVYIDGPRNPQEAKLTIACEKVASEAKSRFKSLKIYSKTKNYGLAVSIISGVRETLSKYGKLIVLEDDMLSSPWFLVYMNESLNLYEPERQVASIHGYCYPVKNALPDFFFLRGADCWGWATWKDRFELLEENSDVLLKKLYQSKQEQEFDLHGSGPYLDMLHKQAQGRVSSWAIRWHASCWLNNLLTLYPGQSLIENFGEEGTHCGSLENFKPTIRTTYIPVPKLEPKASLQATETFRNFFASNNPEPTFKRILKQIRHFIRKNIWLSLK